MLTFTIQATLAIRSQIYAESQPFRNRRVDRSPPASLEGTGEVLAGALV